MSEAPTTSSTPDASGTPAGHGTAAAFFDVDRTLLAGAAALRLARPFRKHGLVTRRQQMRAAVMQLGFMFKGADDDSIERFIKTARTLVSGWNAEEVREIVARELDRHVQPIVYREALERIDMHRHMGHRVYAVSATIQEIVDPLAQLLGLDGGIGSKMQVGEDGSYTGDLQVVCYGQGKADQLHAFAEQQGIDLAQSFAYSDSISDEHFLRSVGRPYAVNPDKPLRKVAEAAGWGILFFRTRVEAPLHRRRAFRLSGALVLGALAALVVSRRRRDA